uniref:Putative cryptochrome 1 n=3 Tax=Tragopogon TaxID=13730 RepID=D5JWT7_TRAPR
MVPSLTTSLIRGEEQEEEEETSSDHRNVARGIRDEVPDDDMNQETARELVFPEFNNQITLRNNGDSPAESSSGTSFRRERDGGVVPVWSPATSSYSEQFVGEESSYLQRSHQVINWRQLSQTG